MWTDSEEIHFFIVAILACVRVLRRASPSLLRGLRGEWGKGEWGRLPHGAVQCSTERKGRGRRREVLVMLSRAASDAATAGSEIRRTDGDSIGVDEPLNPYLFITAGG